MSSIDELFKNSISKVASEPFPNHVNLLCKVANRRGIEEYLSDEATDIVKTGGIFLLTKGLDELLVSDEIIIKGYLPCAYICTRQSDIFYATACFLMGAVISVDAKGKFIKCRSDIFSVRTRPNKFTQWHTPFLNAEISPDFSILAAFVKRTQLYNKVLIKRSHSPSSHLEYQGSPIWKLKFEEWESIQSIIGQKILESGYKALAVEPGKELQAMIAGYATQINPSTVSLDISVGACWLYIRTIDSVDWSLLTSL